MNLVTILAKTVKILTSFKIDYKRKILFLLLLVDKIEILTLKKIQRKSLHAKIEKINIIKKKKEGRIKK